MELLCPYIAQISPIDPSIPTNELWMVKILKVEFSTFYLLLNSKWAHSASTRTIKTTFTHHREIFPGEKL